MATAEAPVTSDPERRQAIAELGDALREVTHTSVMTEVGAAELHQAAELVRAAVAILEKTKRALTELPSEDDIEHGVRVYNPVVGIGNAIAVPLRFQKVTEGVLAHAELGPAYEGPPLHVHGGVSALLMDQLLARAMSASGRWGMTGGLELKYRRPVPLNTPVALTARVTATSGRTTTVTGMIALQSKPEQALVEATAVFVTPRPEKLEAYFGSMRTPNLLRGTDEAS